jgi:hypothetical protein
VPSTRSDAEATVTDRPGSEQWPKRLFSLDEANALLPTLVPILSRLRSNVEAIRPAFEQFVALGAQGGGREVAARLAALGRRVETLQAAIDEDLWMIDALGVELKGIETGLIDFPTMRGGRVVYLCWKLGEGPIAFWHEVDAGFAGRRSLEDPAEENPDS